MTIYVIHDNKTDEIKSKLQSWLPDADILCFKKSLDALESIKSQDEPCLVLIQFCKIAINGTDFLTLARRYAPYFYAIVLQDGEPIPTIEGFPSIQSQVVCGLKSCTTKSPADENEKDLVTNAFNKVSLFSTLHRTVSDIKTKVSTFHERARVWADKI